MIEKDTTAALRCARRIYHQASSRDEEDDLHYAHVEKASWVVRLPLSREDLEFWSWRFTAQLIPLLNYQMPNPL